MRPSRSPIRLPVCSLAALLLLAAGAHGFIDTHLNEIAAPLGDYADDRVAEIDALPSVDKATKKERKLLAKLAKKEDKAAKNLGSDFKELLLGGKTAKKLKGAAAPMRDALDEAFARAELALGERREFVNDHVLLITDPKALKKIQKKIDAYNQARADADAAQDDLSRAKALAKAEKSVTAGLKRAEKDAQKAVNASTKGLTMPPIRLRSGDEVGPPGARISIPLDADSPIAGASVVIPTGALATTRRITIEPADSFVGGRDAPAGPAVRFLPAGVGFNQPIRVHVPFALPPDASASDLALFHNRGSEISATLDVTFESDGTLSGTATSFSEFQAGLLAPPLGAPSGKYHVEMLFVSHVVSTEDAIASEQRFGITDQDWIFRADGSGRRDPGSAPIAFRGFTQQTPFHIDGFSPGLSGSVDYAWEQIEPGRFAFTFPTESGGTAEAEGIVSESGDVIAFSGRGGPFDFIAVGVRDGVTASAEDLAGRWLAVELGAELIGFGQSPFSTRHISSFTSFQADAGTQTLTFDDSGAAVLTDRTFDPGAVGDHAVSSASVADGGSEDFVVIANGRVQGDSGRRIGWLHPEAGVFVSAHSDQEARAVTLLVAVRQPETVPSDVFLGDYRVARLDWTPRRDTQTAFRSFLDVDPGIGTLSVGELGAATLTLEPVERATYELVAPPTGGPVDWDSTATLSDATPDAESFTLELDGSGNHRPAGGVRWYGVSGDGNTVLGASTSLTDLRGLLIGLR
jgi:hypothetical protein